MRLIIAIDGGGIRGVIPLLILKEIQKQLSVDLFKLNPIWWGTSTGAIISGALTIQKQGSFSDAVQNVLNLYEFRAGSSIHPHGVSIPERALDQVISSNFGDIDLQQFPELNIVVSKADTLNPVVFNKDNTCKIADAIRASCAFPGLFPSVNIGGEFYVDGFFKAKNPAELAVDSVLDSENNLVVLSIGTGIMREVDEVEESVVLVDEKLSDLASSGAISYFRFNPELKLAVDSMQNTSAKNILNLRKDALRYIAENSAEITRFIECVQN